MHGGEPKLGGPGSADRLTAVFEKLDYWDDGFVDG